MKYAWYEKDNGSTKEVNSGFSTTFKGDSLTPSTTVNGSVKYTVQANDRILGESFVEYCDPTKGEGKYYKTDVIEFFVRQQ